jgi:hypothetical protein
MLIYVASSYRNISEVREVQKICRDMGHEITVDWTQEIVDPEWPVAEKEAYLQDCGTRDYYGVMEADLVILINHEKARDAMVEWGLAMGAGVTNIVMYPERRHSVFWHLADDRCDSVETLKALLHNYEALPHVKQAQG